MKQLLPLLFLCLISCSSVFGQRVQFAQGIIDSLCSEKYHGRGYVEKGDIKAARFIAEKFEAIGLQPRNSDSYFHKFKLNVNTFPGVVECQIVGNRTLTTGRDFIVAPNCPSISFENKSVVMVTHDLLMVGKTFKKTCKLDMDGIVLVIDTLSKDKKIQKKLSKLLLKYGNRTRFEVQKKLTWSVGRDQSETPILYVKPGVFKSGDQVNLQVEAKFITKYRTKNVVGWIKGSEEPDSFIYVTGHYDHLGRMGRDTYMPGANDNASGIAMILDLAQHYINNPPRYSMVFVAFAAEEAGLVGSYHFVQELADFTTPQRIRFVINMDLMGSGQEGIMAVNGAVFEKEYRLLQAINAKNEHLPLTKKRGKAANSDHYFFTEVGIPAFFFYLMGPYSHYHDIDDTAENLRLEKRYYDGSFHLIRDFADALMGG